MYPSEPTKQIRADNKTIKNENHPTNRKEKTNNKKQQKRVCMRA
jgi:hypothetical protein